MNFRFNQLLTLAFLTLILLAAKSQAQQTKVSQTGNIVSVDSGNDRYRIEVCSPSIIRVRMAGKSGFAADENLMVVRYKWDEIPFSLKEVNKSWELKTKALTARIEANPFRILFFTPEGVLIELDSEALIEIYAMNGAKIESVRTSGSYTKDLEKGIYIIRINGVGTKFMK